MATNDRLRSLQYSLTQHLGHGTDDETIYWFMIDCLPAGTATNLRPSWHVKLVNQVFVHQ